MGFSPLFSLCAPTFYWPRHPNQCNLISFSKSAAAPPTKQEVRESQPASRAASSGHLAAEGSSLYALKPEAAAPRPAAVAEADEKPLAAEASEAEEGTLTVEGSQFLELEREVEAMLEATSAAAAAAERLMSKSDQQYLSKILGGWRPGGWDNLVKGFVNVRLMPNSGTRRVSHIQMIADAHPVTKTKTRVDHPMPNPQV
jgi:hypothetical protein